MSAKSPNVPGKPSAKVIPFSRRAKRAHQVARKSALTKLDVRVGQLEALMADLDRRAARGGNNRRFQVALGLSMLLHVLVITLVTFVLPQRQSDEPKPLEVVLVNAKSKAKPKQANALAQHNLDGGGNTDADRRAKSPLPVLRDDPRMSNVAIANKRVEQLEDEVRHVLASKQAKFTASNASPQPKPQVNPQPESPPSLSAADVQRALNIQRMEAEVAKQWDAYQKRPRRQSIGASASEYRFARYVEEWRQKIEKLGENNFPEAAREGRIYGSLLLTVSVRANGSIANVEIRRSSGHKILDDAAKRIVRMGAPYAPFPADIAKDTDIIDISRTWRFTSSDKLETE